MILSHDGSKILTAFRILAIAQRLMKANIHSFPTMYIIGVNLVEMGQIDNFGQNLCIKTYNAAEQNLDLFINSFF